MGRIKGTNNRQWGPKEQQWLEVFSILKLEVQGLELVLKKPSESWSFGRETRAVGIEGISS